MTLTKIDRKEERHVCVDCGVELSDEEIECGNALCYGCWHWRLDYSELE
jgi:hypothetical protein